MKLKKKLLITLTVVVAVVFISGVSILAATTFGSKTDPLITLSYLTQKLKPQIMDEVNADISAAEASMSAELDAEVSSFKASIDAQPTGSSNESTVFTLVTLSKGQTVTCAVGTQFLLRIGSASAFGSNSPAMIDSTTGLTLSSGNALATNHMYMVTIQGNGFKADSSTVKILVRGVYTIS